MSHKCIKLRWTLDQCRFMPDRMVSCCLRAKLLVVFIAVYFVTLPSISTVQISFIVVLLLFRRPEKAARPGGVRLHPRSMKGS